MRTEKHFMIKGSLSNLCPQISSPINKILGEEILSEENVNYTQEVTEINNPRRVHQQNGGKSTTPKQNKRKYKHC